MQSVTRQSEVLQKYIRPFQLVEHFNLKCGYEKSCKFTQGELLRNRYLLGIDKSQLDANRLQLVCQEMNMPQSHFQELIDHEDDANLVLLGFEESSNDASYRVYLEFWDRIKEKIKQSQAPYPTQTMFLGYKWSAFDNSQATTSEYTYYPRIELARILQRLGNMLDTSQGRQLLDITADILARTLEHTDSESLIYLEASEVGNPRKSFDINLYPAGLKLQDIHPQLAALCELYSVNAHEFAELYSNAGARALGHISGGLDRNGQSFFTVYYEAG